MKRIWEKIKSCWSVLRGKYVLVITGDDEKLVGKHLFINSDDKKTSADFLLTADRCIIRFIIDNDLKDEVSELLDKIATKTNKLNEAAKVMEIGTKKDVKDKNTNKRKARKPKTVKAEQ